MPLKAEWQQEVIPLGPDRVGFVADAGGKVSMIQVGLSAEGKAELSGILDLPLLAGAPQCCLAAHRDRIFFPVQPPGQHITIYEVSLNAAAGGGVTKLHEIPGVMGAEVRGCAMVPWKGSPHVLIHYHLGLAQHFWLVHPEMGEAHPLGGIPLAAHDVRIRWEQGRVFWINLSEGKIKAL
jgi:hypothetical protein